VWSAAARPAGYLDEIRFQLSDNGEASLALRSTAVPDHFGVRARLAAEAELPQLLRRLVVAMDQLVEVVDLELPGTVVSLRCFSAPQSILCRG
jgi:hypothetical protein